MIVKYNYVSHIACLSRLWTKRSVSYGCISVKYVPWGIIDNAPTLLHIKTWYRTYNRPSPEPKAFKLNAVPCTRSGLWFIWPVYKCIVAFHWMSVVMHSTRQVRPLWLIPRSYHSACHFDGHGISTQGPKWPRLTHRIVLNVAPDHMTNTPEKY